MPISCVQRFIAKVLLYLVVAPINDYSTMRCSLIKWQYGDAVSSSSESDYDSDVSSDENTLKTNVELWKNSKP
jgi:benzoyl-CoA reductase/2-hydroxyglutaryl-CoA dehydratase subunit BcrC/BadD/HgdB